MMGPPWKFLIGGKYWPKIPSCSLCPIYAHACLLLTTLNHVGSVWTSLDHFRQLYPLLINVGPFWTSLDQYGPQLTIVKKQSFYWCQCVSYLQQHLAIWISWAKTSEELGSTHRRMPMNHFGPHWPTLDQCVPLSTNMDHFGPLDKLIFFLMLRMTYTPFLRQCL